MSVEFSESRGAVTNKRRWQTPELIDAPVDMATATTHPSPPSDFDPNDHNS